MQGYVWSFLIALVSVVPSEMVHATHNRAGEITYVHAPREGELYRFQFTITTYTRIEGESIDADRPFLTLRFGDGTSAELPRVNGPNGSGEVIVFGVTKKNVYQGFHTYGGPSTYVITMEDPNRIDKIININGGESVQIPFVIVDTLFMPQPDFFGFNNSPVLNQPPIDNANRGYPFIHNPNAVDIDGDSLHFQLVTPLTLLTGSVPTAVPNYLLPDEVSPQQEFLPPSGNLPPDEEYDISINPLTGEIVWDSPWQPGIYNIAILIKEYRNGVKIGSMIRDMQIEVFDNDNDPPQIAGLNDTCITVNDALAFVVEATDANNDNLDITANGLPFDLSTSPATFEEIAAQPGFISGQFEWTPDCDAILSQPYSVVFKVEDDFFDEGSPLPLADLETWNLQVIAPAPNAVTTTVLNETVLISWGNNYVCSSSDKFLGFSVWRKMGCDSLRQQNCADTPELLGYTLLDSGLQTNSFVDNTFIPGITYSYAITAEFADIFTGGGIPINFSISLLSDASCVRVPSKIPLIYNVDVLTTDVVTGNLYIEWSRPKAEDLDTFDNPGPYRFELFRELNGLNTLVFESTSNFYTSIEDTMYTEMSLNTTDDQYSYYVDFYSNDELLGPSSDASSIYLTAVSQNSGIDLSWSVSVPWTNVSYKVFRKLESESIFTEIAETTNLEFKDIDVTNGGDLLLLYRIDGFILN